MHGRISLEGDTLFNGEQYGGLEVEKKLTFGSNIGCQENTLHATNLSSREF